MVVIELDEVDTSGAFTANVAHIDVELQGATDVFVPVGPVSAVVIGLVKDEGAVVQTHLDAVIFSLEVGSIEASQVELINAQLAAISDEHLHLSRTRLGLGLKIIIFLRIVLFFRVVLFFLVVFVGIRGGWLRSGRLGLWARLVRRVFSVTPLEDLEVGDLVDGILTAGGRLRAHLRALFDGGVRTICVIPGGDDEAHAAFDVSAEVLEVVLARSLHYNLLTALADPRAELPEVLVAGVGHELSLDVEGLVRLDHGTTGAISVLAISFLTLFEHVVLALTFGFTATILAGVSRDVETVWVGLHNVNAGT
jgi:hypothetical protein